MLVLTRREHETIRINDDIKITIVRIRDDRVRIGIDAPKKTPIHRGEVFQAIKRQREAEKE